MLNGSIAQARERLPRADAVFTHDIPLGDRAARNAVPAISGALTENRPVEGRSATLSGSRAATFFEDYYNRVHLIPPLIDFGSISGTESATVRLWNARLTSVTLSGISSDDTSQGVDLSGTAPPRVVKPLAVISYSAIADELGPADIGLTYTFSFSNGEQPRLPVSGVRAVLFPFWPNWRDSYRVAYEFKTEIFKSRSGREQRRALRSTPRKAISFTITEPNSTILNRFMVQWQNRQIAVADRSRHAPIVAGIPASGNQFTLTDVPDWVTTGESIVLDDGDRQIQATVDTVSGGVVTLHRQLPEAWPASTLIYPAVFGRLGQNTAVKNFTDTVIEADIELALTPGAVRADDAGSAVEIFNGREVMLFNPNWATPISGSFEFTTDTLDFMRGRIQTYTPIRFDTRIRQLQFLFPTQRDRVKAISFFGRMKGQRGEFYMPTWENDMTVARGGAAGTRLVWVRGVETFQTYQGSTTHRAIVIRRDDGTQFYRRVTAISTDGSDTLLETDIAWPLDLPPGSPLTWLVATRFAVDRIELECVTDQVSRVQYSVRSLEDLTVADDPWAELDAGARWLVDYFGWVFSKNTLIDPLDHFVNTTWYQVSEGLVP